MTAIDSERRDLQRVAVDDGPFIGSLEAGEEALVRLLVLAGLTERWGGLDPSLNRDLDDLAAVAGAGSGMVLVARLGGRIVGTGTLVPRGEGTAEVVRMSVAGDVRRRGIGRAILAALVEAARQRCFERIVLETSADWHDAVRF